MANLLVFSQNTSTRILGILDQMRILGILAQKSYFCKMLETKIPRMECAFWGFWPLLELDGPNTLS